ncbi:hypothetical protein [Stenotrophomonas sp. HMWF023]|uniref:hypothetical protein n=1 Tax=Stenotrophomonas sp. HMWF023 TaxID=2056859 RepID=UPI0011B1E9CB|nr:hypothetical protein [Stenotrophomonas sp. HMWF023]
MKIRNGVSILCALVAASLSTAVAANQAPYQDRPMASADGKRWIERTAQLSDFNGGLVAIRIRFFQDGKGGLVYRFDDQIEATKLYHQAACEVTHAKARRGETVVSGEAVAGWSCESEATTPASVDPSAELPGPMAGYYVYALAPSGSAPLGVNFNSVGTARYQSSIAGQSNATLSIDNGRCMTSATDHYAGPFTGTYTLQVVCIGERRGLIDTAMSACIPQLCSTNNGAIDVL